MAPKRKLRQEKRQTTLFQFASLRQKEPSASSPQPPVRRRKVPLRPLPSPSAPPFFHAPPPKRKQPPSDDSLFDVAFEMGERVVNGTSAPNVKYCDEGIVVHDSESCKSAPESVGTPRRRVIGTEQPAVSDRCPSTPATPESKKVQVRDNGPYVADDSDEDFEPESVRRGSARTRLSSQKKHSVSALRDDRASMTKRSASKRKRVRKLVADPDNSSKVGNTALQRRRDGDEFFRSNSCDDVVVEGTRSEMSATEDEEEGSLQSLLPVSRSPRARTSARGGAAIPRHKSRTKEDNSVCTPGNPPCNTPTKGGSSHSTQKDSGAASATRRLVNLADSRLSKGCEDENCMPRARNLWSVIESDSDSDDHQNATSTPSKARRRTRRVADSSDEDEPDGGQDVSQFSKQKSMNGVSVPGSPSKEIELDMVKSDEEDGVMPLVSSTSSDDGDRNPPRRGTPAPFVSSGSGVKRIILTPDDSPSPPSTRKRRTLSRLKPCSGDEEEVVLDNLCKRGSVPKASPCVNSSVAVDNVQKGSGEKQRNERWYDEKRIEEYSSSSDIELEITQVTPPRSRPRRKLGKFVINSPDVPNVRRDILKDLLDEDDNKGISARNRQPIVKGRSPARRHRIEAVTIDLQNMEDNRLSVPDDSEVIDLIDEKDTRDVHVDEEIEVIEADEQSDFLNRADKIRNSSSGGTSNAGTPVEEDFEDDGKPPPFNLIVLCNEGESIAQMKDRLGEDYVINKVSEAQEAGREIIGGEEIGLTSSFNRNVFNVFSKRVVGDHMGQKRKAKIVTEQALRGEYKFNYRGREWDQKRQNARKRQNSNNTQRKGNGRLANLRRRLR